MDRKAESPKSFHVLGFTVSSDNASQKLEEMWEGAFLSLFFSIPVSRLSNHLASHTDFLNTPATSSSEDFALGTHKASSILPLQVLLLL